ncbi:MAG: SH3 domain-containing protein [Chloroflexi bacterium]|jgi:cytoskeletal protein RodZ|nr:SH3 domain-containing protein [Chloroflexota bacterium]
MSLDSKGPNRGGPHQDLWPKWMWVAVPVLVVVVVAGLWWAIFSPPPEGVAKPTPSPTVQFVSNQPTQEPTKHNTLAASDTTPTRQVLPLATFTPTPQSVVTPEATLEPTPEAATLAIGAKAKVANTGAQGLNMRSGAGTGHARVKTLPEGSVIEVIGGPQDANGFTWWQVRDEAGTTGWVASQYLVNQ